MEPNGRPRGRSRARSILQRRSGRVGVSSYAERRKKRYAEDADYRERTRAYNHAWYVANRERVKADRRRKRAEDPDCNRKQRDYYARSQGRTWLKYYYGISVEEYDALLARQNGKCAICREKPEGQTLCVDHCHATGKIRGLLCRSCNVGLGNYRDDPRLMRAAIVYLEASLADDPQAITMRADVELDPAAGKHGDDAAMAGATAFPPPQAALAGFRPHPEERAHQVAVRTLHARARVSKDEGGPDRGGLMLRDASQRDRVYADGTGGPALRCSSA